MSSTGGTNNLTDSKSSASGVDSRRSQTSQAQNPKDSQDSYLIQHQGMSQKTARLISLKQSLLDIRARRAMIPDVPNPKIVQSFSELHQIKTQQLKLTSMRRKIFAKKKQYTVTRQLLRNYKEKYELKSEALKQRPHLIKILTSKLQNELQKTRDRFKEVQFNNTIITAVKKVCYYRLAEIFFNQNARNVFGVIDNMMGGISSPHLSMTAFLGNSARTESLSPRKQEVPNVHASFSVSHQQQKPSNAQNATSDGQSIQKQSSRPSLSLSKANSLASKSFGTTSLNRLHPNSHASVPSWTKLSQMRSDEQVGICLGYLGLLITLVGQLAGTRMWINFTFRGSRSTIRLNDGTIAQLTPKERRINEALKLLNQQLYQIMRFSLNMNVDPNGNFYQMSEELSKHLMS